MRVGCWWSLGVVKWVGLPRMCPSIYTLAYAAVHPGNAAGGRKGPGSWGNRPETDLVTTAALLVLAQRTSEAALARDMRSD